MANLEEEAELSVLYENSHDVSTSVASKRRSDEGREQSGINLHRLVLVSFGLLCILQAVLNVSLRLSLSSQQNSLTRERDELRTQLNYFASQQNSLTRERDELRTKLNDCARYSNQEWMYFRGSFYYISLHTNNWQDSRADCLRRGADLMIINSDAEQEFTRQIRKRMWIGLTDMETEGSWKWVDGSPVTISFWYPGEPNNNGNENCGQVNFSVNKTSWNDASCDLKNFWICEKIIAL